MTREIYVVTAFYPVMLANLISPGAWLSLAGGILAFAFLVCQAKILHRARGIPAWRAPLIPWMIVASGLLEGVCMFVVLLVWRHESGRAGPLLSPAVLALLALNAALWIAFRTSAAVNGIVRSEEHTS